MLLQALRACLGGTSRPPEDTTERNIEHRIAPAEGMPRSGLWSLAFGEVRVATDAIGTQNTFIHMPHSGVAPTGGGVA